MVVSPIASENTGRPGYPDGSATNARLKPYVAAMKEIAKKEDVVFVDLFAPTTAAYAAAAAEKKHLTINGIHLSEAGDKVVGKILDEALFGAHPKAGADLAALHAAVDEKNLQYFYDYRAVNGRTPSGRSTSRRNSPSCGR